jgi:hypothetical protein
MGGVVQAMVRAPFFCGEVKHWTKMGLRRLKHEMKRTEAMVEKISSIVSIPL